MAIIV